MQLAGATCAICKQNVMVDTDATWCARCASVLHRRCLGTAEERCPFCQKVYDAPEGYFVFSEMCPECFRPNAASQPSCVSCAARTRWDDQAAYEEFVAHMKRTSRHYVLRGLAELAAGAMCLLALGLPLFVGRPPGFLGLGLFLLGFITLTADGIVRLIRSRQIAKFE